MAVQLREHAKHHWHVHFTRVIVQHVTYVSAKLFLKKAHDSFRPVQSCSKATYKSSMCVCTHANSLQLCPTLCNWTVACQAPLSMGFSRQECWSGLPCPPPGDLPNTGIKPPSFLSPALAVGFFTTRTAWETHQAYTECQHILYVPTHSIDKNHWIGKIHMSIIVSMWILICKWNSF